MSEIIHGLSNEEYHNPNGKWGEYISSSQLKLYQKSPRAYKYALDHPTEQTDAMKFGSLFHDVMAAIAEGASLCEALDAIAVFEPPINERTGKPFGVTSDKYKDAYKAFTESIHGTLFGCSEDKELVSAMVNSLLNDCGATSEQVKKLLRWTKATEVSYFLEEENGIKLKVRPDALTSNKLIDWKTCTLDSLDEESIAKQIIKYRYDVSLSMYQYVLHEMEGKWYQPFLVFASKVEPHESIICDMSEWCYSYDKGLDIVTPGIGALEFSRLLKLHTNCVKANEWPGIEHTLSESDNKIMKPAVPYWFGKKYFEEE